MKSCIHFLVFLATSCVSSFLTLAESQAIRLVQSELRYGYEVELLKHVLKLTEGEFGPAETIYVQRESGTPPP